MKKGIYKITNKINGKVYIGESFDIESRWRQHINELNNNTHHSYKLQHDWNKYGKDGFKFEIIKDITNDTIPNYDLEMVLLLYEFNEIKKYDSINKGYNIENTVCEVYEGKKKLNHSWNNAKLKVIQVRLENIYKNINSNNGIYVFVNKEKKNNLKRKEIIENFVHYKFIILCDNYEKFNGFINASSFCRNVGIKPKSFFELLKNKGYMDNENKILNSNNKIKSEKYKNNYITMISFEAINIIKNIVLEYYKEYDLIIYDVAKKHTI